MRHVSRLIGLSLLILLAACTPAGGGGGGTRPTITAFTATPNLPVGGGTTTLNWTVSGATSLSIDQGVGAVTPVTTGSTTKAITATTTFTLTATNSAGSVTATATTTVTPPPTTITVAGSVQKFNGDPAVGVVVQVDDATGTKPQVVTDGSGNFTVPGVQTPYTISAVPPTGSGQSPITFTNVTRTDPKIVVTAFTGAGTFCASPAAGTLNVTLSNPVGTGNTGRYILLGVGIANAFGVASAELGSFRVSSNIAAGVSVFPGLSVPFDTTLCQTTIAGKIIYIETNNTSGAVVNVGTADVTITTGNTVSRTVTVVTGITKSLRGTVTFPVGLTTGVVYSVFKVGGASAIIFLPGLAQNDTTAAPTYDIAVPDLISSGVQFRTLALATVGSQFQWVYSDILSLPATADLSIPSLGTTQQPAGAIGLNTTPTFTRPPVSGMNMYFTFLQDAALTGSTQWIGTSTATSIKIPALPAPGQIVAGTAATPKNYSWNTQSINVRGGAEADKMLDGRMVKKLYIGLGALYNGDEISTGSVDFTLTNFSVP